jgi:hypothetical protein
MDSKLGMNYQHFTKATPHETRIVRPRAIRYGSYSDDVAFEGLAMIGLAVLTVMTVSLLLAFSII